MSNGRRNEGDRSRRRKPTPLADALSRFLDESGLAERVAQAAVVPEWPRLVGGQIAQVTSPLSISRDGTLFVAVRTNAWMNELSLLEPQLMAALNSTPGRPPVKQIRWQLMR